MSSDDSSGRANINFTVHSFDHQSFNAFLEGNSESIQLELKRLIKSGEDRYRELERDQSEKFRHALEHHACEMCRSSCDVEGCADGSLYFGPVP